jgi:hypothetical protein
MNGTQTRREVAQLGKAVKLQIKENHLQGLYESVAQLHELLDYATKQENYFKYEIDEDCAPTETPESWRFEKVGDAARKYLETAEQKMYTLEARIERKLEERKLVA